MNFERANHEAVAARNTEKSARQKYGEGSPQHTRALKRAQEAGATLAAEERKRAKWLIDSGRTSQRPGTGTWLK